jgi:hypothetical protein
MNRNGGNISRRERCNRTIVVHPSAAEALSNSEGIASPETLQIPTLNDPMQILPSSDD